MADVGDGELSSPSWEDRLSELADYRKNNGHCNVPGQNYNDNSKLASWVANQRQQYKLQQEGTKSHMTTFRIQALESLGFVCGVYHGATWEAHLSELADYRKIHGHCNDPHRYSKNSKVGYWVTTQRYNYNKHREGKKSPLTAARIQALESLGFE
jgi:hypothetical protein